MELGGRSPQLCFHGTWMFARGPAAVAAPLCPMIRCRDANAVATGAEVSVPVLLCLCPADCLLGLSVCLSVCLGPLLFFCLPSLLARVLGQAASESGGQSQGAVANQACDTCWPVLFLGQLSPTGRLEGCTKHAASTPEHRSTTVDRPQGSRGAWVTLPLAVRLV